MNINIAFPVDKTNWINCFVSILSIIENTASFVNIYILEQALDDDIKKNFQEIENKYKNICKINIVHIEKDILLNLYLSKVTIANSWFRILFPNLCPNVDKVIFMAGCATIVTGDLSELYNSDISDKYILAADDVLNAQENVKKYNLLSETYSNINILLLLR